MFNIIRRMRTRLPTCLSMGLGDFLLVIVSFRRSASTGQSSRPVPLELPYWFELSRIHGGMTNAGHLKQQRNRPQTTARWCPRSDNRR